MKPLFKKIFLTTTHEKINLLITAYKILKTRVFYARIFKHVGRGSMIGTPLTLRNAHRIHLGEHVKIRDLCRIEAIAGYDGEIRIGNHVDIEQFCQISAAGNLSIGDQTAFGYGALVTTDDHDYTADIGTNILKQPLLVFDTTIGKCCFIGSGAKILAGTTLGDNSVVAANTVIRGVYPENSVIAGSPARIIKRFDTITQAWRKTDKDGNFL